MGKILVVDDNAAARQLTTAILRQLQHNVLQAADGAEALLQVQSEHPDLVICDILMPTMDGFEFVRQLRANRDIAATNVILCTATFLEREARALAESCGVMQVLTKPIDPQDFRRIVDAAMAQQAGSGSLDDTRKFDREHLRLISDKLIEKDSDLESANQRLSALIDLNLRLASERDPNALLDQLCRGARELIGSRFAALGVRDMSGGECLRVGTWGIPAEEVARLDRPSMDGGVFTDVLQQRKTISLSASKGDVATLALNNGLPAVRSALIAPIASPNHCYGWVFLGDKLGADAFTAEDERLLTIHAAQAGRIYESCRLYATAQRHAMQQSLAAQLGQQALASTDLGWLLAEAVNVLRQGLEVEYCEILRLAPDGSSLVFKAGHGWGAASRERQTTQTGAGTQSGFVLDAAEPVVVADYRSETRFASPDLVTAADIRSGAHVLMNSPNGAIGIIGVYAREPRRFTTEDVRFQRAIAYVVETAFARKYAEERVNFLGQFNSVTELPNRSLFLDRLAQALVQAKRGKWLAAVIFVDLDRFKIVNETHGHAAGDRLLQIAAKRLTDCVPSGDTVAHPGADEFAIVLSKLSSTDAAISVAAQLVKALSEPFELSLPAAPECVTAYATGSVGVALYPSDGTEPAQLLKNADIAMSRAKDLGRNNYQFYTPLMNERAVERSHLETGLRVALKNSEYLLHYQPKVSLRSGDICGFEALLRWQHPERGLVPPVEFISILEETGLIESVGNWVLRTACEQVKRWQDSGLVPHPVAVNLSARQFRDKNFCRVVDETLRAAKINPSLLEFELTESILMQDTQQAAETLRSLKALGVSIAIDDFGTGYSSLAYLKRFPLDTLKIDREFVRDCVSDPQDAAIARSIVRLAHSLGLKVVAEGVEDQEQLQFLSSVGCDEMQGYYFSRPLPETACTQMLTEGRRLDMPHEVDVAIFSGLMNFH